MPDLNDLIHRLTNFKDDLNRSLPDIATSVSLTAKALAERTIKDRGFGEQYSTKGVPTYWLYPKVLNAAGTQYLTAIDQEADELGLDGYSSWKGLRAAQGLQVNFVDLSYSNEMWSGMQPLDPYTEGDNVVAPLGNINKDGQDKMNYNHARYGDFIGHVLTGDNRDALSQVAFEETIRILQRNNV